MTHLDLDALADLLAGEGSPQDVAHVGDCAACSEALSDLDASLVPVAAELAALAGEPLPALPEGFAERLDARLRAAGAPDAAPGDGAEVGPAALSAPGPSARAAGSPSPDSPVTDLSVRRAGSRAGRRAPAVLGLAAGLVGLVLAGGVGVALLRPSLDGGQDTAQDATAALSAPDDTAERLESSADGAPGGQEPVRLRTGTDYAPDAGTLAGQLPALLRGEAPVAAAADVPYSLAQLLQPAAQASCLSGLSATVEAADAQPLLLDQARAFGEPALLVVLRSRVAGAVEVAAVGPGCTARDLDLRWSRRVMLPE